MRSDLLGDTALVERMRWTHGPATVNHERLRPYQAHPHPLAAVTWQITPGASRQMMMLAFANGVSGLHRTIPAVPVSDKRTKQVLGFLEMLANKLAARRHSSSQTLVL